MEPTFEWDAKKARRNLRKHGVSFEEAKSVFLDPLSITVADPAQTVIEDRFVDIGTSAQGRVSSGRRIHRTWFQHPPHQLPQGNIDGSTSL